MITHFKTATYSLRGVYPLGEYAYTFDCTLFRLTCLTVKALGRITMRAFLVGAIEDSGLKLFYVLYIHNRKA